MKQAKKIFTRMCLNNWGGINHKILEFHEYVNLFSGEGRVRDDHGHERLGKIDGHGCDPGRFVRQLFPKFSK